MNMAIAFVFTFALGVFIGMFTQYLSDCRYTKSIKELYEAMVAERDKKIETQKTSIDRLIKINNDLYVQKGLQVNEVRYARKGVNEKWEKQ